MASSKHIIMSTIGSAGDVHPLLGLGIALQQRGHQVTIATNAYFRPLAEKEGLGFFDVGTKEAYEAVSANPDLWHPRRGFAVVAEGMKQSIRPFMDFLRQQDPAESIVVASSLAFGARIAQEKWGIPLVTLHLQPSLIRSLYETPSMGGISFASHQPSLLKRAFFKMVDTFNIDPALAPEINAVRGELGLPPVKRIFGNWMHSPQKILGLFPDWFASPQPDWPANVVLTGFVNYDAKDQPGLPTEVTEFLADGEPPVLFTAGSEMQHASKFFETSARAADALGVRAILLTKFPEQLPKGLPHGFIGCRYLPFSQILPHVAALVYHGGIGTLGQALTAGVPHLVVPYGHDQPDNGLRLKRLGVGEMINSAKYRLPQVVIKLDHLLSSPAVQATCKALAGRLDTAKAIEDSCAVIESVAQ